MTPQLCAKKFEVCRFEFRLYPIVKIMAQTPDYHSQFITRRYKKKSNSSSRDSQRGEQKTWLALNHLGGTRLRLFMTDVAWFQNKVSDMPSLANLIPLSVSNMF